MSPALLAFPTGTVSIVIAAAASGQQSATAIANVRA
jgi:hypothetical protein